MIRRRPFAIAFGLALASATGGCRRAALHDPAAPAMDARAVRPAQDAASSHDGSRRAEPDGSPIDLVWSADGSRLAIDGRLVLDVHDGRIIPVPCPSARGDVASSCAGRPFSLSPDGAAILFAEDARLFVDPIGAEPRLEISVPHWLPRRVDPERVFNAAFWLSPGTLFVQQSERHGEVGPACRLADLPAGGESGRNAVRWRAPAGKCLAAGYEVLSAAEIGPENLLALYSSGEGGASVDIVRYDPRRKPSQTDVLSLSMECTGVGNISFAADGSAIFVVTPCNLPETAALKWSSCFCEQGDEGLGSDFGHWRLYRRPIGRGRAELVRADLPPDAVRQPMGDRYAWLDAGAVCVGEPRDRSSSRCYPLPPSP